MEKRKEKIVEGVYLTTAARKKYNISPKDKPPSCTCGCNKPVTRSKMHPYNWNTYVLGHINKGKKFSKKHKNNIKKSFIKKYGVDNPFKADEVKEKIKSTNLKRNGAEYPSQVQEIQEKRRKTNLKRYGVSEPLKSKKIRNKIRKTNLKRYGVSCIFQAPEIEKSIRRTHLEKYGVPYNTQSSEVMQKIKVTVGKVYKFPSGREEYVEGYENFAIDYLLQFYNEKKLILSYPDMPEIWYSYKSKKHKYFPDIFIPSENIIVEVKAYNDWWRRNPKKIFKLKQKAVEKLGYSFWYIAFKGEDLIISKLGKEYLLGKTTRYANEGELVKWSKKVKNRDNRLCQCCFKESNKIVAHHIESFRSNPELRFVVPNGITLCYECHFYFHIDFGYYNNNKDQLDEFIWNTNCNLGEETNVARTH